MAAPEHIFRIDPVGTSSATILIVPPLFEEANRTRRTLVLAMRALAAEGFAALLPDLPGQNESQVPLIEADLTRWHGAIAAGAGGVEGQVICAWLRGGALSAGWAQTEPGGR